MDTLEKTNTFVCATYARQGKAFVGGSGMYLTDEDGQVFTDFLAGIAVCSLGHCHPEVTAAIQEQAGRLVHVSNLFYTRPQADLACALTENSFADRVFFCNSGAEANEAAIKLARRYFQRQGSTNRSRIITMTGSFHGRTMATLTATGQDKVKQGFYPLVPGFSHVPFNDFAALEQEMDDMVCAVMLEPVQGEGGVIPADPDYLAKVRQLCDKTGTLLIFDEIQTGMGRCGTLFAHQGYGVTPDIMTLAKALGNGVPIGAMLATEEAAKGFEPGSHGSTFGGTPLAAAAGLKTLSLISDPGFLAQVREKEIYFKAQLETLRKRHARITDIRGKGLLLGMEVGEGAADVAAGCFKKGFIVNAIQDKILRFAPPLIVQTADIDRLVSVLDSLL
jgi:acetylornithine aminotransferase